MNYNNLYQQNSGVTPAQIFARGDQGYAALQGNYDAIAADAAATRDRNMGRIDQYGASMRQDLDIAGQQALAKASQSAIMRGLGNTTIQDSLVRGQNFDNGRQRLALEDQLLQNRISTDSSLSGAYQGVLQNRAQGLAGQWNANTNLYTQQQQMDNANQQAALARAAQYPQQQWTPWTGNAASRTLYR